MESAMADDPHNNIIPNILPVIRDDMPTHERFIAYNAFRDGLADMVFSVGDFDKVTQTLNRCMHIIANDNNTASCQGGYAMLRKIWSGYDRKQQSISKSFHTFLPFLKTLDDTEKRRNGYRHFKASCEGLLHNGTSDNTGVEINKITTEKIFNQANWETDEKSFIASFDAASLLTQSWAKLSCSINTGGKNHDDIVDICFRRLKQIGDQKAYSFIDSMYHIQNLVGEAQFNPHVIRCLMRQGSMQMTYDDSPAELPKMYQNKKPEI